ncbi:MAG TPA: heme o synthase [Byssovorax sp.]
MTTDAPAVVAPGSAPASRGALGFARDLVALSKPRVTALVIVTEVGAMGLALRGGHTAPTSRLVLAVVGVVLVVAGASVLNMFLERDSDRLMDRTRGRPLPAGRVSPQVALAFGVLLSAIAVPMLTFGVNAVTGLLAALALVIYVLVYTPMKRRTTAALVVGALPGAAPPLLGWTSVTGRVDAAGLLLFGILFAWQIPHFLAIATFRRADYARAGLKVLPVERGDAVTRRHIVAWLALLLAVSLALVPLGVGGALYLVAAATLGAGLLAIGAWGLRPSSGDRWARQLFVATLVYLTMLFAALVVSP